MTYSDTDRHARADDPLRLAYAARILTAAEELVPRTPAPAPCVLAGRLLFVPVSRITAEQCDAAAQFANEGQLDFVLVDRVVTAGADPQYLFTLGMHHSGQRSWRYALRLWRPADASPCCFVPEAGAEQVFYRVRNGVLFCAEGWPWSEDDDADRGFELAHRGLTRLLEGR